MSNTFGTQTVPRFGPRIGLPSLVLGLTAVALLVSPGCRNQVLVPDLGGLYNDAARQHDADRNPVIVVPGLLGSRLVQAGTGRVVWGAFAGDYADPRQPDGARLFALPMRMRAPLNELVDDVQPDGALESIQVKVFGLSLMQRAYVHILATLGAGGFRDESLGLSGSIDYGNEHFTCFQFAYDWRRDIPENARLLGAFVEQKKAYVEAELLARYGIERDVRFDIVAHSLGGLLLRYWLRYGDAEPEQAWLADEVSWAGAQHIERAVLIGTPSSGSITSFENLVRGVHFSRFLPAYSSALTGTLPVAYQLLPRERHYPLLVDADGDGEPETPLPGLSYPELWQRHGWGLADPDIGDQLAVLLPEVDDPAERRAIALDHQAKCLARAALVHAALDRPADPPPGLSLHLIAGDAVMTTRRYGVLPDGDTRPVEYAPGDGTVLRSSALADERAARLGDNPLMPHTETPIGWSQVLFLFQDHLGLTRDPVFIDNLLYLLLEAPRR